MSADWDVLLDDPDLGLVQADTGIWQPPPAAASVVKAPQPGIGRGREFTQPAWMAAAGSMTGKLASFPIYDMHAQ